MPRPNPAGGAPQTPWAARRAAYFYASRGFCNVPTPLHFLLIRERFMLPEDELEGIEIQRRMLASMLGGEDGDAIMALLDCPTITLEQVEAMVAGLQNWHALPQPCATPEPAPEPGYRPAPKSTPRARSRRPPRTGKDAAGYAPPAAADPAGRYRPQYRPLGRIFG